MGTFQLDQTVTVLLGAQVLQEFIQVEIEMLSFFSNIWIFMVLFVVEMSNGAS